MSKKQPQPKGPDNRDLVVSASIHTRLKALATKRRMWLGGLTIAILEAYLDQLDAGEDWLEKRKGDG